jgi:uncharacterized protein DUF488/universal stress protein family protein
VSSLDVRLGRVYDPATVSDGYRVLIDRLWPRGVSRERHGSTNEARSSQRSVLVARRGSTGDEFPTRVVVGVDGSPESATVYAVARHLSERSGAELWPVVAHGGRAIDRRQVDAIVDGLREESSDEPVGALVTAAADADLLVVGSRGLHGLQALGSLAERAAHRARSSVLIVREPALARRGVALARAA